MSVRPTAIGLRTVVARLGEGGADRDLLREFVRHRSEPAFAELVRRYGPLVLGVCRRTLGHTHDAEDAFQVTFLVLACRAGRITTPEGLPGWLHRVAVRSATEIRHVRDRRSSAVADREYQEAEPSHSAEQRELAAALDAELAALPEHYRLPVVLCELRGLSRKQAASELAIPEGTLSSRLAKARKLLADRLTRRGFAASVTTVTVALANTATAHIPIRLAATAVKSAVCDTGPAVASAVTVAADTVVKAMFAAKLKGVLAAGGLFIAMAGGLVLLPGGAGAQPGGTGGVARVKADPAEALVRQLGSTEYAEREAAEKALRELGAKAVTALKAGLASGSPEVVQRCERVLGVIRKDEADRFVQEFRADTEFTKPFDHPIWTRWAKLVGNDRGSRELFGEVLGVEGTAQTLNALDSGRAMNADLCRGEVFKWREVAKKRAATPFKGRIHQDFQSYTIGEAAYVVYLTTFPDAVQAFGDEYTPGVVDAWMSLAALPLVRPGTQWHPRNGRSDPILTTAEQAACDRMKPVANKLLVASLLPQQNPWTLVLGLHYYEGNKSDLLPLAKSVCRDKTRSAVVRAAVLPLLARFGETDYLPDMVALQEDRSEVHNTVEENGRDVCFILACDVAIASQLLLYGQKLQDFDYPKVIECFRQNHLPDGWQYSASVHGFIDNANRKATRQKALAFLKTAPKLEPKRDERKSEQEAERLVRQLGSREFAEREAAEKRLKELGYAAMAALRTGKSSASPEVAERCERVIGHIQTERLRTRFIKLIGDDKPARDLFTQIRGSGRGWAALVAADENPAAASETYRNRTAELVRVSRGLTPLDELGQPGNPHQPRVHAPPPVPFADVAAWLFLGTFTTDNEKWSVVTHKAWQNETSSHFEFLPEDDYTSAQAIAKEYSGGAFATPLKTLTAKWLDKRRENDAVRAGLTLALRYDIRGVLPVARALLERVNDAEVQPANVAAAIVLVGEFGTQDDVPLLRSHLADTRVHVQIVTELPKGITGNEGFSIADLPGVKKRQCQVRDAAAAAILKLSGRDLPASGFQPWPNFRRPMSLSLYTPFGFHTDEERQAAFDRERVLFLLAPVPKPKPALPKKLDRLSDPSPELRKELFLFDENYRHGTPEKFAALEKKADELAKQYPEKDDQARIWYEVAHVAGQSDIRKQAERVKKYAAKCLEVSRDPLQRGTLYSYLAGAEEVNGGAYAERRKKATEWLLTGYLELLAQELPDQAPELPGVGRFDVDGPGAAQARAQHAAQMAAREQAQFIRDQVERRDVLVQQLRDLYKPDAKRAGRDASGPDELKQLAAKKLPSTANVDDLLKRVLAE